MTKPSVGSGIGRARPELENEETIAKSERDGPSEARSDSSAVPAPASAPPSRYEIRERLGAGGMGVVSTAFDRQLRREVAVKVLRPELLGDPQTREQFTEEAVVLAGLDHPGAVPVFEAGNLADGSPFCAMKKVRGRTLRDVLFDRTPESLGSREDLAHLLDVFERVCQTVAAAHDKGIVHRDLKPDNVMVDDLGAVYVMDWGLAFSVNPTAGGPGASAPSPGEIAGTPSYMAPEQARGSVDEIGTWSDVFSLGTILYEILTGRNPFREGTAEEAMRAVQVLELPPAVRVNPRAGRALSAVCRKAMSKEARQRYATARELAEEIQRYREFRPVAAVPPTLLERAANWARRRPAAAASIGTFLAVLLLVGAARGYRAYSDRKVVEQAMGVVRAGAVEISQIEAGLAEARRDARAAPPGAEGDGVRASAASLEELRDARKERLRSYALAIIVFTRARPDARAQAVYRREMMDEVLDALKDREPTRAESVAQDALDEYGRWNLPGWTEVDVAWLKARRDEARALVARP